MEARYKRLAYYKALPRWKQVLLDNPDLFILRYFAHRIEKLEEFHLRLIDNALNQNRALTLYPAGHGKTTLTSTICPILHVCRNPDVRVAVVAKNMQEAENIMRSIQQEFIENELLIQDFGPFRSEDDSKAWSLSRVDVAQRKRRGKESTLAMFGASSKDVLGYRTDATVCDDVVTDLNSNTEDQRAKMRNWFDMCVETGPEHADSALTVVGTRFHPNDLYGDLIELDIEGDLLWKVRREDAVAAYCVCGEPETAHDVKLPTGCAGFALDDNAQKTLWPERWPWKRLMMQKVKVGTLNFNKRYRNIAVDPSRLVFREEYVKGGTLNGVRYPGCRDRNFKVGDFADNWRIVAGFDPAFGSSRTAKFCAHIILAEGSCIEHEKCYWVVDLDRDQWTQGQQVDRILQAHEDYPLLKSLVEANSAQAGLLDAINEKMDERGIAFAIEPHYTTKTNKPDPEFGVQRIGPWIERQAVHIPWGDGHSQRKMNQLVEELIMYPDSRTTDTVMAFWFAWRALQLAAPKMPSYNRLTDVVKRKPWAPHRKRSVRNPIYPLPDAA